MLLELRGAMLVSPGWGHQLYKWRELAACRWAELDGCALDGWQWANLHTRLTLCRHWDSLPNASFFVQFVSLLPISDGIISWDAPDKVTSSQSCHKKQAQLEETPEYPIYPRAAS
jgi:hypothetical protein